MCGSSVVVTHPLLAGLEPVGEQGCSGSTLTRQDGNEQPSPKLQREQGGKEEVQRYNIYILICKN